MLDNGIIDPRDTRNVLGFLLGTIWERKTAPATQCLWRWAHVIRFAEKEPEMTAPETQTIDFELDADWATLWLNRPDARNAMSDELVADLRAQWPISLRAPIFAG